MRIDAPLFQKLYRDANSDSQKQEFSPGNIAIILIIAILPHIYKLFLPQEELFWTFIRDDVFYYYKTAINIAQGLGSTFDTYNFTNGYHPLWMLVCIIVALFNPTSNSYLYLILLANLLFVVLFSFQLLKMFTKSLGLFFAAVLIFIVNWNIKSSVALYTGLETPLYLWIVFIIIRMADKTSLDNTKQLILMGILFGLAFLARTDFLLFLPVFFIYFAIRFRKIGIGKLCSRGFLLFIPFLLFAAPFLIWNYITMGSIQQISGLVKSYAYSTAGWTPQILLYYLKTIIEAIVLFPEYLFSITIVFALFFGYIIFKDMRSVLSIFKERQILLLGGFSFILLFYYYFSYGAVGARQEWHIVLPIITLQVFFVHILRATFKFPFPRLVKRALRVILLLFISLNFLQIPYFSYRYRLEHPFFLAPILYHHKVSMWIKDNLPQNSEIGVWDAGYVAYFSKRNIINLDGFINGRELYEYYRDGRGVWRYIIDNRIDYISNHYYGYPKPLKSTIAAKLELVYHVGRSDITLNDKETYMDWYVWKVHYDEKPEPSADSKKRKNIREIKQ